MRIPETLKGILPTNVEISKGIRAKTLKCPKKTKKCENDCANCETADELNRAFLEMGRPNFGETITIPLERSKQTTISGIGSFEIRNGTIMYELNKRIDMELT